MAGLTSALGPLMAAAEFINLGQDLVGTAQSEAAQSQALAQLKAQQNAQIRAAQENAALDKQRLALDAKAAEDDRKRALRRAVARQQTIFGSSGIGGQGGSSQAVLLGLVNESEQERTRREDLDRIRLSAIDTDLAQQKRLNVLQRTQLQERNGLDNLSSGLSFTRNLFNSR